MKKLIIVCILSVLLGGYYMSTIRPLIKTTDTNNFYIEPVKYETYPVPIHEKDLKLQSIVYTSNLNSPYLFVMINDQMFRLKDRIIILENYYLPNRFGELKEHSIRRECTLVEIHSKKCLIKDTQSEKTYSLFIN